MSHTTRDKQKLLNRVRRIRGQVEAVEQALIEEKECALVLQTIAACRGAMNALLAEILEGHIRYVVCVDGRSQVKRTESAEELIDLVRAYLK